LFAIKNCYSTKIVFPSISFIFKLTNIRRPNFIQVTIIESWKLRFRERICWAAIAIVKGKTNVIINLRSSQSKFWSWLLISEIWGVELIWGRLKIVDWKRWTKQGTKDLCKLLEDLFIWLEDLSSWIDLWLLIEDLGDERENPNFLYIGESSKDKKKYSLKK